MWLALGTLSNNKTPTINGERILSLPAVSGDRVSALSGPSPAALGRGQGRATPQVSAWATSSQRSPAVMKFLHDSSDSWVSSTSYSHWPLHIVMKSALLAVPFRLMTLPCGAATFTTARAAALRDSQGHCLNCHETSHSFKQCTRPITKNSGYINSEFGQLGDNGEAYHRWQERMLRYHRQQNRWARNKLSQGPAPPVGSATAPGSITHLRSQLTRCAFRVLTAGA